MLKKSAFVSLFCLTALTGFSDPAQAYVTARDIRTETRTGWDYQPGQGPRYRSTDKDYFRPAVKAEQPLIPPPPVVEGDWRDPPRAESMVPPKPDSKKPWTETSLEAGLQISSYHYHESSLGVKLQGPEYGLNLMGTAALGDYWFLRGEGRVVGGRLDYKGSGVLKDRPNYIAEVRATAGRDLVWRNFGISPYVGVGYRFLNNDIRGTSTTGAQGYVRRSQYLFAPIGLQPRVQLPNGDRLTLTAEFDPLIRGWQESNLSGAIDGYPDLTNVQKGGYGARGELMYQRGLWTFGPFVNYWNINQSDTDCGAGTGFYGCGYEPHNHTLEYGMQFRYRFLTED